MRIAYQSLDEVNRTPARKIAGDAAVDVCHIIAPPADVCADACIYDLDHMPLDVQQRILADLTNAKPALPVVIQAYSLDDHIIERLDQPGVRVCRRLDLSIFERLTLAAVS